MCDSPGWGKLITIISLSVILQIAGEGDCAPTSVVVLHPGRDESTIRLAAELSALGYAPILLQYPTQPLWIDQVRSVLTTYRAEALINATSLHKRVDIWIVDSKSENMQLFVDTVNAVQNSDAATILKSLETLRAGLMRIECVDMTRPPGDNFAGANGRGTQRGDADSGRKTSGHSGRFSLALGPAVAYGFGEFPVAWQIAASANLRIASHLFVALEGFAPTAPMSYKNEYGSAQVWTGSLRLGLRAYMRSPEKRVRPWAQFGIGPYFSRIKGFGVGDYSGNDDRTASFEMMLSSGIRVRMSSRFSLEAALFVADCVLRPVVKIGEVRAEYAAPLFGGAIQIAVDLF